MPEFRIEKDSMGEMQVPADAYYAAQTARAVENFPVSNLRFGRRFIAGLGLIKLCCAQVNRELGLLDDQKAKLDDVKVTLLNIKKTHEADREKHLSDVKQLILSDKLDAAKVKALMAERQKMVDANFDTVFAKVSAFHASLTPEQKKKAAEFIDKISKEWE